MNTEKIGWIGLGKMGTPMAQQLIKAGYPVTVYNRHKDKEQELQSMGAETAASPAELIENCDIIILMVTDDQAIHDIYYGDKGLCSVNISGKTIVNMSTVSPAISKEIAEKAHQQGNYYLDAPVSGSVKQAEEGQLVVIVGGENDVFDKVKPVLQKLGKMALLVGETGAGNTAKLVVNTFLAVYAQALSEAVVFAKQNNIKIEDLLTIINNSALSSPFAKIKGEAIINDSYKPAFALKHIVKDLGLAKDIGLNTPLGNVAHQTFDEAAAEYGDEDLIAVIKQIGK